MVRRSFIILFLAFFAGCTAQQSLKDINATKVYAADVPAVFDAVRVYAVNEAFIMDRFEQESGRIIAHKTLGASGFHAEYGQPASRLVVMALKVRQIAVGRTELAASVTFGGGQVVANREDEGILLDTYNSLFTSLQAQVGPPREESH